MKYRRLNNSELEILEKRFVEFLAANTVTASDWEKIKRENVDKAENLIEIFSDIVFDETLEKLEYMQHRTASELRCFHCQESKMIMMGLLAKDAKGFDFREKLSPDQMMEAVKKTGGKLQVFSAEKKYNGDRKQELFKMMQNGCLISKGEVFKALQKAQEP